MFVEDDQNAISVSSLGEDGWRPKSFVVSDVATSKQGDRYVCEIAFRSALNAVQVHVLSDKLSTPLRNSIDECPYLSNA